MLACIAAQCAAGIYDKNIEGSKIDKITGWAQFVAPNVLNVSGTLYTAPHICIASGGSATAYYCRL